MKSSIYFAVCIIFFSVLSNSSGDDCPTMYKRYSRNHSYCRPANSTCQRLNYYISAEDKKNILHLHNRLRSKIATGQEKLPTASDMLQMEWDDELADVAQRYANQCLFEHDCADCRRVMNFGVGQNIAMQQLSGANYIPQPDWKFAVNEWFNEIVYFKREDICPFTGPFNTGEFRHFSQVVWAKTFRVGCGYVLYQENSLSNDPTYVRLYYCNYGPEGNVYDTCMYETGPSCRDCPENTCCGASCYKNLDYPGLCKRTDKKKSPFYPPTQNLFFCDFGFDSPDCKHNVLGSNKWKIIPSVSGGYLEIVLNGGENSTIAFKKKIASIDQLCVTVKYRKGPSFDGDIQENTATEVFYYEEYDFTITQPLPSYEPPARNIFSSYMMTLENANSPKEVKITFAVPHRKPSQFLNIKSVVATAGSCS